MPKHSNGKPGKKPPAPPLKARLPGRLWAKIRQQADCTISAASAGCPQKGREPGTGAKPVPMRRRQG